MMTYIISFILCSGLLLLAYHTFLSGEKLYRFNRFYLLFSLVFAMAVPFITIKIAAFKMPYLDSIVAQPVVSKPIKSPAPVLQYADANTFPGRGITSEVAIPEPVKQQTLSTNNVGGTLDEQPTLQAPATDYLPGILVGIYGIISIILLVRFAKNSWHISQTVAKNIIVNYDDIKLVLINEDVTPHSFLKYIFINRDDYNSGAIEPEIICHEQTHVRQLHSVDIIMIELLQIVCWFNPFIPFYRKAIQLNHEFLADEAVIENYDNTPAYQYLLLAKATQASSLYLTSQFNYQITKKRLIMMTKNTSAKIALYKKLAMLPLLAAAIFLFSQKAVGKNENLKNSVKTVKISTGATKYALHIDTPKKVKSATINFRKPRGMMQILITYPSAKVGASATQLKEYAAIEAKYLKADGDGYVKIPINPVISVTDRANLEDLFALMSKEQQKKQKIAFTFNKPYPLNVPTQAQVDLWKSDKSFRLMINNKLATGAELSKYQAKDFSYFYKAHIEWQVKRKSYQKYEIELMTTPFFTAKNEDRIKNSQLIYQFGSGLKHYRITTKGGIEMKEPVVNKEIPAAKQNIPNSIKITGEIMYPGVYASQKGNELATEFIKKAGGVTPNGSIENIQVFRAGKRVKIDFVSADSKDVLLSGDSISVQYSH